MGNSVCLGKERSESGTGRGSENAESPGLELEQYVKTEKTQPSRGIKGRNWESGKRDDEGQLGVLLFGPESVFTQTLLPDSRMRGSPYAPPLLTMATCKKEVSFPVLFLVKHCLSHEQ